MRGLGAALALAVGLWSACAQARETVVVEADPWCPHTCDAADPKPGYMIEVAREALARSGFDLVYKSVAWARVIKDVQGGQADGAAGTLAQEARTAGLILPEEPLGLQSNVFVVRADDPWTMQGLGSIGNRRVGSIQDYSYSAEIDQWLADHPDQVRPLGGGNALERNILKLLNRRIDVVVDDAAVVAYTLARLGNESKMRIAGHMPGGAIYIAFSPAKPRAAAYAAALSAGVREMRKDGSLARILARYGVSER
ncbi:MAG: substrate-binding periplasmic protein [Actinomycetota bacterium]